MNSKARLVHRIPWARVEEDFKGKEKWVIQIIRDLNGRLRSIAFSLKINRKHFEAGD